MDFTPNSLPRRVQVVIAGAGPAGLTLANFLGLYGVTTLVIEQNAKTVGEPRAVSIDDESFRTLQTLGLAETAMKDCAPGYGSVYLGPNLKPFAAVHPSISEFGWPKRNAFRQPLLEALLAEAAAQREGVQLAFQATVLSHDDTGSEVKVLVEQNAQQTEITCDYFVGCDGGRSRTRKAIGAALGGSSFEEKWLIIDLLQTTDPFRETRVYCDPYRPALSLPGPNRARRFEIRLRPGETAETMETEARARDLIAWYGGDRNAIIERLKVYTFQARVADLWQKGRVFLAGDAAHLTPPFAGQGMNAGIRDVSNLAWKLAVTLQGRLGPKLLDTYQTERKPHAWAMIMLAVNLGRVMSPHSNFWAKATRALFRGSAIVPPARDYLVQMKYKPKPRFREGFLLPATKGAGTMLPQPRVEVSANDDRRLDDLLGPAFTCLIYSIDPATLWTRLSPLIPAELQDNVIAVLPEVIAFPRSPYTPIVRDMTGAIGRFLGDREEAIIIVRPDRYVAAVLTPKTNVKQALFNLVKATQSERAKQPALS